jgi:hypothetical protein
LLYNTIDSRNNDVEGKSACPLSQSRNISHPYLAIYVEEQDVKKTCAPAHVDTPFPSLPTNRQTPGHTPSTMRCDAKQRNRCLCLCLRTLLNARECKSASTPTPTAPNPLAHVPRIPYLPIFSRSLLWIKLSRGRVQATASRATSIWCWLPLSRRRREVACLSVLRPASPLPAPTTATTRNACATIRQLLCLTVRGRTRLGLRCSRCTTPTTKRTSPSNTRHTQLA